MKAIVVADKNWGIGKNNKLLTHLPGDLKFFKEKTLGNIVVMGRKTLESLPGGKPLPGRVTIVMTKNSGLDELSTYIAGSDEGIIIVHSMEELRHKIAELNSSTADGRHRERKEIFIAGGAAIYRDFLPFVDSCFVTKIDKEFDADKYFPDLDADEDFVLVSEGPAIEENGVSYRFTEYERKHK